LPLFLVVEQLREEYNEVEREGGQLSWDDMESLCDTIRDGLNELGTGSVANLAGNVGDMLATR
jgi:hypothetical protein